MSASKNSHGFFLDQLSGGSRDHAEFTPHQPSPQMFACAFRSALQHIAAAAPRRGNLER